MLYIGDFHFQQGHYVSSTEVLNIKVFGMNVFSMEVFVMNVFSMEVFVMEVFGFPPTVVWRPALPPQHEPASLTAPGQNSTIVSSSSPPSPVIVFVLTWPASHASHLPSVLTHTQTQQGLLFLTLGLRQVNCPADNRILYGQYRPTDLTQLLCMWCDLL